LCVNGLWITIYGRHKYNARKTDHFVKDVSDRYIELKKLLWGKFLKFDDNEKTLDKRIETEFLNIFIIINLKNDN
jgi:hypothetical protein